MFRLSRFAAAFCSAALLAAAPSALADGPYYVRGINNDWDTINSTNELADLGGGHYSVTISGLTPGTQSEYKIANADWSENWPGSNGKIEFNPAGAATFHLHISGGTFSDGWSPAGFARVGYDSPGFGWEVIGSFEGWTGTDMTDQGGGLYTASLLVPSAGEQFFKFRKDGTWDISIGDDFGNSALDISFNTATDNQEMLFELDLPGGRWRVSPVPEPATAGLLALGGLALLRRRR